MHKKAYLLLAGLFFFLLGSDAGAIKRVRGSGEMRIEIGSGLMLPVNEDLRDFYNQGLNGRISFYQVTRRAFQFGLQYRIYKKEADPPGATNDLTSHFIGLQAGGAVVRDDRNEIMLSALLYLVHARRETRIVCFECPSGQIESSETGPGLGAKVQYSYLISESFSLGTEIEYNSSFLDDIAGGSGNVGGVWLGAFAGLRF